MQIREIAYGLDPRQRGDLFLPDKAEDVPPVLLIHGGGWNALSKETMEPVARFIRDRGAAVYSINYRLISQAPWPACGDDCLAAASLVLEGGLKEHGVAEPGKIMMAGASAGGHLAMMTGLRLPRERVSGILSMAGPSRFQPRDDTEASVVFRTGLLKTFFGKEVKVSDPLLREASPCFCVPKNPPPLALVHSSNDLLVPLSHAEDAAAAWSAKSGRAEIFVYDGPGAQHGFWTSEDLASRELVSACAAKLDEAFNALKKWRD